MKICFEESQMHTSCVILNLNGKSSNRCTFYFLWSLLFDRIHIKKTQSRNLLTLNNFALYKIHTLLAMILNIFKIDCAISTRNAANNLSDILQVDPYEAQFI